jgi:hypothetical protein
MDNTLFSLPKHLLQQIASSHVDSSYEQDIPQEIKAEPTDLLRCNTCQINADSEHFKSDWHRYNLKRKLKNQDPISLEQFDELSEISSIEASDSEEEVEGHDIKSKAQNSGSPFVHFDLALTNSELLVYKQVLSRDSRGNVPWLERLEQLQTLKEKRSWAIFLLASGHFTGVIFDCFTKQPKVHKAFHRYTTRRKQGGAQSSNDKSKGKANSAGAGIRRYNEQALREEIQDLLTEWKMLLNDVDLIFIRAPVTMRKVFFYDENVLSASDERIRTIPFITKRPTIAEATRCFELLSLIRIQEKRTEIQTKESSAQDSQSKIRPQTHFVYESNVEKDDSPSERILKILDAIRRGKLEFLISNVEKNDFSYIFGESYGTSLLHYAASQSQCEIIEYLLEAGFDPTQRSPNKQSRPFDVASSKEARDVFRRFRSKYPDRWDYGAANIPAPLTSEMEEAAKLKEQERRKKERERKKQQKKNQKKPEEDEVVTVAKKVNLVKLSATERETLGMTPEQKMRYEREKRAMAAEARMRCSQNKCGNCGKSLVGLKTFDKSVYRYCSMDCLRVIFNSCRHSRSYSRNA